MKIIKQMLALILSITLTVSVFPGNIVAAQETPKEIRTATISVENNYAKPGKDIEVKVSIKDNPGILGAVLTVSYDDKKITLVNAENGEAFSPLTMTSPGKYTADSIFNWDGQEISSDDIKDGDILKLVFRISDEAKAGDSYNIDIKYNPLDVVDGNLKPVKLDVENGVINILNYIPGDLNDDGRINSADVISLRRYIVGNYEQTVIEEAGDVNSDGRWNSTDIIMIRRYIAEGYDVKLEPAGSTHIHNMVETPKKDATCTENGNIGYWHCVDCNRYYRDKNGVDEIELENTVIEAKGHKVVIDPYVAPTTESTGLTEGSHCSVCEEVIKEQHVIDKIKGYAISYNISNGDTYLAQQNIDNPNPVEYYSEQDTIVLENLAAPEGYVFLGWFDGAGENAVQVKEIKKGSSGQVQLYAHWKEKVYDVTYKLYQTPLAPISDEKFLHYTVSKGLVDLPNPTLYNYVFLGWYNNEGIEVKRIDAGTTGNIELNAYWTSKRNLTKKVSKLEDPIVVENPDDGVMYFTYEIGTIENVPVSDAIWTIQSVAGLAQQTSKTVETSISEDNAQNIMNTISNSTVDSKTWSLSSEWSDVTTVNETWAESLGVTQEEAMTKAMTSANTISISSSEGGTDSTTTTDGTTVVKYGSKNTINETGSKLDVGVNAKYTHSNEASAGLKVPLEIGELNLGGKKTSTFEIGGNINYEKYKNETIDKHTGKDTTTVKTTVNENTSNWNNSATASSTNTASESRTLSKALSQTISNTKEYGRSYAYGGANSESQGLSSTSSKSTNTSSTLTYSTATTTTTTSTYSTDGKSEGCYRLVIAGTVHVFAVVGYDVATKSYFTYTYNVMDDKTYEFLDYSPDLQFNDCENGVIPFEVPYYVYDYVTSKTVQTKGVIFKVNSENGTAEVVRYDGTDSDVTIPSYVSAGNKSYKVTGIAPTAFAGKDIRAVVLSDYIDEIPDSAFENCSKLEEISGYFTKIGDNAFKGCISLEGFNVSSNVTEIGTGAFKNVPMISVTALNSTASFNVAKENNPDLDEDKEDDMDILKSSAREISKNWVNDILQSGADKIKLDISELYDGTELTLDVPAIDYFELNGGKNSYKNLSLNSKANETVVKDLTVTDCKRIPFNISSKELTLEEVSATNDSFVLLLTSDGVKVTLIRDSRLISNNGKAIVCKNPVFESKVVDSTIGILETSGNIYVCGNITGQNNIDMNDGEIINISEDEFDKYIKGVFKITFDANGGTADEESKTTYYGEKIGDLPNATRDNCIFKGWYTEDGTEVTSDTEYNFANDLTLKAHWYSDWTEEENLPGDAVVTDEKWTYDLTTKTTSDKSSLDGYTLYDTTWVWGEYGNWSGWSRNAVSSSDSRQVGTTTVTDRAGYTNYNYWVYRDASHHYFGTQGWNGCNTRYEINLTYPLSVTDSSKGLYGYAVGPCGHSWCTQWFAGPTNWVPPVTHTEYRYRDRSKIYTYHFTKTENMESDTEITESDSISNVKRMVKFIIE